jgi:hypothetical protein
MAIGEAWKAWQRGESWNNVFGYAVTSQEEIDRGRSADSRLMEMNRAAFETGKWNEEQYLASNARLHTSSMDELIANPDSSPWAGFQEGLKEGAANVQGSIKSTLAAPFNFTMGAIPWQVWLAVGLFLGFKLGLFDRLFARR